MTCGKNLFRWIFVAAMATSVVGCGGDDENIDTQQNDEQKQDEQNQDDDEQKKVPSIAFLVPTDAQSLTNRSVDFEVRIDDAPVSAIQWTLNGESNVSKSVDLKPGDTFSDTIEAQTGANTLVVTAFSADGASAEAKVVFLVDAPEVPIVSIEAPADALVFEDVFELKAHVDFDGVLTEQNVLVNDTPVEDVTLTEADSGYDIVANVPLAVGSNDVVVEVVAENGERADAQVSLSLGEDTEAPTIHAISPHNARSVRARSIFISGSSTDNLGVTSVEVSAGEDTIQAALTDDGHFSATIDVVPGPNAIVITAADEAGNTVEVSHSVYYGAQTAAGGAHSGVLLDNVVYAWGRNNRGQVGLGYTSSLGDTDPAHPVSAHQVDIPGDVVAIDFSQNTSFALTNTGEVYAWGDNSDGQLCLGVAGDGVLDETHRHAPEKVELDKTIVGISRGYDHTLFLTDNGELYACGDNGAGQLGDGTTESSDAPIKVASLTNIIAMTASSSASYALTKDGEVFAWGDNADGTLGQGTSDDDAHTQPTKIDALADVVEIAAGKDHALALTKTGELYGWGLNASTQVGSEGIGGFEDNVLEPTLLSPGISVTGVLAEANQSFVYDDSAHIYGWGQNGLGNLGVPEEDDLASPVSPVFGLENLIDVGIGALHSVALRADGRVFAWGWSFQGSLGAGDSSINAWSYRIPVIVEFEE